jgi:hypothetical protein
MPDGHPNFARLHLLRWVKQPKLAGRLWRSTYLRSTAVVFVRSRW